MLRKRKYLKQKRTKHLPKAQRRGTPSDALLLVEDDDSKRKSIRHVLANCRFHLEIHEAKSVGTAIAALRQHSFKLLVVDMSLPTYDLAPGESGGTPRPFGGLEIFDFLDQTGKSARIIVVTSFPALSDGKQSFTFEALGSRLSTDYSSLYEAMIFYDPAMAGWEHELILNVNRIYEGKDQC